MSGILVFFHCGTNAGFAIARLERVFLEMARRVVGDDARIHFAYPDLDRGRPEALPPDFANVLRFDPLDRDPAELRRIEDYVRTHGITLAFGFDQTPRRPGYAALRRGGVRRFVSYWGAPMSDLNTGMRLLLKRLEVALGRSGPDRYIFESEAMRRTATEGRGIPSSKTVVTYLGVDPDAFTPAATPTFRAHDVFGIPRDRQIVYYSGHFEARKGVAVIVAAAAHLVNERGRSDIHFVLLGNRDGEEVGFAERIRGTPAERFVTFGGYRSDVAALCRSASIGVIASTGWDSFTMSALEIAASGLPLLVSNLQGLAETVEEGVTGFTFPVGDFLALADRIASLIDDPQQRSAMSAAARRRILSRFTVETQIAALAEALTAP